MANASCLYLTVYQSFRDKAVEVEASNVTAKCSNKDCPWEGLCKNLEVHVLEK